MTPERLKDMRKIYNREMEAVEETLTNALCETYKDITGKTARDEFREKIADAIRYDAL